MRKFFSIIIVAYQSEKIIDKALQSILDQNMNDEIEIIISDDCSGDSYEKVINKYKKELDIILVKTEYNCCPGNTRQRGVDEATGEWITFIDADDVFLVDSFRYVKNAIESNPKCTSVISPIPILDIKTNKIVYVVPSTCSWTHGKFYNMDNLWKKYNLSYKKDLLSHEDVYITNFIDVINGKNDFSEEVQLERGVYLWKRFEGSLSHKTYVINGERYDFLERNFEDYLIATGWNVIDKYQNGYGAKKHCIKSCLTNMITSYFYCQYFIFTHPQYFLKENIFLCRQFWEKYKDVFNLSTEEVYLYLLEDSLIWQTAKEIAQISLGYMIEPMSFREWIEVMDGKEMPSFDVITID